MTYARNVSRLLPEEQVSGAREQLDPCTGIALGEQLGVPGVDDVVLGPCRISVGARLDDLDARERRARGRLRLPAGRVGRVRNAPREELVDEPAGGLAPSAFSTKRRRATSGASDGAPTKSFIVASGSG